MREIISDDRCSKHVVCDGYATAFSQDAHDIDRLEQDDIVVYMCGSSKMVVYDDAKYS